MANKHVKGYTSSLVIKEMKIKTTTHPLYGFNEKTELYQVLAWMLSNWDSYKLLEDMQNDATALESHHVVPN